MHVEPSRSDNDIIKRRAGVLARASRDESTTAQAHAAGAARGVCRDHGRCALAHRARARHAARQHHRSAFGSARLAIRPAAQASTAATSTTARHAHEHVDEHASEAECEARSMTHRRKTDNVRLSPDAEAELIEVLNAEARRLLAEQRAALDRETTRSRTRARVLADVSSDDDASDRGTDDASLAVERETVPVARRRNRQVVR